MSRKKGQTDKNPRTNARKIGGYRGMALAICDMAAKDYAREFCGYLETEPSARERTREMKNIEDFFESPAFCLYSGNIEPSEMLKRSKLRGVGLFYQDYIDLLYRYKTTGKSDMRMLKRFEDFIYSAEYRDIASRVLSVNPAKIIRNAHRFCEEHGDKISRRKYSTIRYINLDGSAPGRCEESGEM